MWLTYIQAAMAALVAVQQIDGAVSAIITQVNTTIDAAKADGNRDPTPEERAALDKVIDEQMAKLDAA